MTCDLVRPFIEAYADGELDAAESLKMERHLTICDSCSQIHAALEALRVVVRREAPRYQAPDGLRARIQSGLRASPQPAPAVKRVVYWRWSAIAASVFLAAVVLWQMQLRPRQERESLIASEIVSSHVRSLMANHLVDEPSSDQHAVKPWFAGKLDFSPAVKNLDSQGFMLAGGRLDYIGGRSVAAIVYRRRQHVINLFVWPSTQNGTRTRKSSDVNGYNTVSWMSDGMRYWAISDLNQKELELFSQLAR